MVRLAVANVDRKLNSEDEGLANTRGRSFAVSDLLEGVANSRHHLTRRGKFAPPRRRMGPVRVKEWGHCHVDQCDEPGRDDV